MPIARLTPLVLLLAAAPGALAAPASGAPTPAEPAGVAGPMPLPLGGSVNARLPEAGPARYRFEAPGPGELKVAVGGAADLVIGVLGPEGLEAAAGFSDQDLEGAWTERVGVPIVAAGAYQVLVQAHDADAGGAALHLAAAFVPGEPQPSDTFFAEDIALMRALAEPGTLRVGNDAAGTLPPEGLAVFRLEAAPGLYAVLSASDADLDLAGAAASAGSAGDALALPSLGGYSDAWSDADFGGEPGREAMVLEIPAGETAWVRVGGYNAEEARFRLRLQPLSPPDAAD
ncbi:hypothetical protein [Phycisphaera mikurensis]|uniref:Peptidase C-terminal archaeal/bacterial domain-containing protein n=1 Tax=Phycisphaera mikurensis (strain NBRC 102666 / KCTC 22515 / FYK2301M01) TaxID=1142394 RepID=I0IFI9_PHYMF|nr:hypothetical protein [Phycisphaera mikurensis]MBB6440581.1 hypothetical protein [Phycisphaera mikurensis]BAM04027.1 hypothetical protein PSMK_18680 [Phycisphaera mikurensis NBRC 102666]